MLRNNRMCRWLFIALLAIPFVGYTATPVKSMVVFGDSLTDVGNTTHLLKSLRQEEAPAFLVAPFKIFVINKMIEFADEYYVPQIVLDAGIAAVTDFFDYELAPYIANLVAKVKLVPILPGQPYWKYRFSNGKVWVEYLAEMMSIQKSDKDLYVNRAFGGSWAATYDYQLTVWNLIRHPIGTIKNLIVGKLVPPSLGLTVQAYLLEHQKLNPQSVYFIYSGGNDYINVLFFEDNYNSDIMSAYIDNVLDSITSAMQKLAKAGAKRFVVMGVPSIGDTPKFLKTLDREVLNAAVDQHNERLVKRIEAMKEQNPELDILYVDTKDYLQRALVNPEKYGFSNVTDACIDVKFPMFNQITKATPFPNNFVLQYTQVLQYRDKSFAPGETNYQLCDAPEGYLFWDEIHPSTKAHHLMAYEVCLEMQKHGYNVNCKQPDAY